MTQNRPPRGKNTRPGAKPNERSHSERPKSERPYSERPKTERSYSERPKTERPYSERPKTERPHGERPKSERPQSETRLSLPGRNSAHAAPVRGEARTDTRPDTRPDTRSEPRGESRRGQGRPAGPPAAPPGTVWLYGTHAVGAALLNPHRRFRKLVITEEAQAALAEECPLPWPLPAEITPRDRIDALLGARPGSGIVHQGIALLTDQLQGPTLQEALRRPGPVLVLDQIYDPRNVGALLRTAQAFGACAVIAQDRNAPEETGALAKAASGALETIPLLRIVNIARALLLLKAENLWVIGLDGTSPTRLRAETFAGRRVALVLGNEGEGMRRLVRETCDEICALSMPGGMESLNVSAAGAVALYELTRLAG